MLLLLVVAGPRYLTFDGLLCDCRDVWVNLSFLSGIGTAGATWPRLRVVASLWASICTCSILAWSPHPRGASSPFLQLIRLGFQPSRSAAYTQSILLDLATAANARSTHTHTHPLNVAARWAIYVGPSFRMKHRHDIDAPSLTDQTDGLLKCFAYLRTTTATGNQEWMTDKIADGVET